MKQAFHKIASFLLAMVVVFSTLSFTIAKHYCGDTLVDTAIFHKAEGCGMEMQNPEASSHKTMLKKGCCNDELVVVEGQDELKITIDSLGFEQQLFIVSLAYAYCEILQGYTNSVVAYSAYHPPRVVKIIYQFDESYLI